MKTKALERSLKRKETPRLSTSSLNLVNSYPELANLLKPKLNKYIPYIPHEKQAAFLLLDCKDAFVGGAAFGGKSIVLMMAALQYVEHPDYNALLVRDSFANLSKPDGLIDISFQWLAKTDAKWKEASKTWLFPSGATLTFGHLDGPRAHFNYQSSQYQFIGIDEVVSIPQNQALYLFSRLRRTKKNINIPLRFRCASNPPAPEQLATGAWVKERYVDPRTRKKDVVFIPAKMDDNPFGDIESYRDSLSNLDHITRRQLEEGDWEIAAKGKLFDRTWFHPVDIAPDKVVRRLRFWDLAATEVSKKDKNPDWTVGIKMSITSTGVYYIEHMVRFRKTPAMTEATIRQTAELDSKKVEIFIEQESGASGKMTIDHFIRDVLRGFATKGQCLRGRKAVALDRARPVSTAAEAGLIYYVRGIWNTDFLEEIETYPHSLHDDCASSLFGAFSQISESGFIPRLGFF